MLIDLLNTFRLCWLCASALILLLFLLLFNTSSNRSNPNTYFDLIRWCSFCASFLSTMIYDRTKKMYISNRIPVNVRQPLASFTRFVDSLYTSFVFNFLFSFVAFVSLIFRIRTKPFFVFVLFHFAFDFALEFYGPSKGNIPNQF